MPSCAALGDSKDDEVADFAVVEDSMAKQCTELHSPENTDVLNLTLMMLLHTESTTLPGRLAVLPEHS